MSYCTYCGAANYPQASYCAACGNALQGLPSPRRNATNASGLIGGILAVAIAISLIGGVALVSIHLDPTFNFLSSGNSSSATADTGSTQSSSTGTNGVFLNGQQTPVVQATISISQSTPTVSSTQSFQCPSVDQVSSWMNVTASQVTDADACAFHGGDISGQTLSGAICTNQDGGTSIEYTPVAEPKTLVVANCDGSQLPEIYGFTIRFLEGYPSSGQYSANVCAIAQAARARQGSDPLPSDWTVQAPC